MTTAVAEKRTFRMHHALLFDVIQRQAGTLSKGVLEGDMNSIDAKATECHVTLDNTSLQIRDNGKGFRNRQEIETWFEVFGQPHEESEGKVYGTFRMGRGQLFAHGHNKWRTGTFSMDIDIKNRGLDYELRDDLEHVNGCTIDVELYEKLCPSELRSCEQDLERWCKYAPIPIFLNGKQISTPPSESKWDFETDEAYIRLTDASGNGLAVYNCGIHVMTIPGYKYGVGGEVVSKQQVKVNFARNDIQSDCPVWNVVKKMIDDRAGKDLVKKKSLNDNERKRIVDRCIGGVATWVDIKDSRIITAVTGRQYKPEEMLPSRAISSTRKGCHRGDSAHRRGLGFVLADETLDRFGVDTVNDLISLLAKLSGNHRFFSIPVVDFDTLAANITDEHELVSDADTTVKEKIWLEIINESKHLLAASNYSAKWRNVCVGISSSANGWTDEETYIAISRAFLAKCKFDIKGFGQVARLLLHEMCHTEPDLQDHVHDQEFYEQFHEAAHSIGDCVGSMLRQLPRAASRYHKQLTKLQLREQDHRFKADEVVEKYQLVPADEE